MLKRYKDLLRIVVTELRHTLGGYAAADGARQRGDLDRELERLGVAPDGTLIAFDAVPNPTPADRAARRVAEAYLVALPETKRAAARAEFVERAAYTWINRLLALRAMEARGLIGETLRPNPDYGGVPEALYLVQQMQPGRAAGADGGWWAVVEDACAAQAANLPGLFAAHGAGGTAAGEPAAALHPTAAALRHCIEVIGTLPNGYTPDEADAAFADPDAIGWAYQFYQEEAKAATYRKLGAGGKAETRAEIASITQLFTEPYMVKWLLQNSLGRTYHELYPDSKLPETWEYYIRPDEGRTTDDEPIRNPQSAICDLQSLTFMDPCMGSGHFEREAFDMVVAMYREQYPDMSAAEIADRILTQHLHGIDLDPRAAQLAALTLYLRAWELVADERRAKRLPGPDAYRPPAMNLATTPTGLLPGSLERHLARHPEDELYRPLLAGIFAALEQADLLGSLLRPGEHLDAAITAYRERPTGQTRMMADDAGLDRLLAELAATDPASLKQMLLVQAARSFAAEAGDADDVSGALFGQEAGEGLRLLQLLDRKYTVVATNPPYMGSRNMVPTLKKFVEKHYHPAKADLYAVFILRCIELCCAGGRIAMVTMHSWLFLSSFARLRCVINEELPPPEVEEKFRGLLRETTIDDLAHLGAGAFTEIGGAVVQAVLFGLRNHAPAANHSIRALRGIGAPNPDEKAAMLRGVAAGTLPSVLSTPIQEVFTRIPNSPICYWLPPTLLTLLQSKDRIGYSISVKKGLDTADNSRFVRLTWEAASGSDRWYGFPKGGGYGRWVGYNYFVVDWELQGARIKSAGQGTPRNEHYYGIPGLTYTEFGQGCLGTRHLPAGSIFSTSSPGIFLTTAGEAAWLLATLNCRISSYLLRVLQASVQHLGEGYVPLLPSPKARVVVPSPLMDAVIRFKQLRLAASMVELEFIVESKAPKSDVSHSWVDLNLNAASAILHTIEGQIEQSVFDAYGLTPTDSALILGETGTPAGWYPLVTDFDTLPVLLDAHHLLSLPDETAVDLRDHQRLTLSPPDLTHLKQVLRVHFEAGPGRKDLEQNDVDKVADRDDESGDLAGATIPIPAETFLEELSQKLQIHPISVYWLLEELRAEGARCKPEELRLLEDRLNVLVLRLLGHRWPKQIEAGEPVPGWADRDGVIPLTPGAGETPLADRIRSCLRADEGDLGLQGVEALLAELTGLNLEEWLRTVFFPRHVRQFKHRPIAWHLASAPRKDGGRRTKARRVPAFECLVYYHACKGDVLARIRTRTIEPLIRAESGRIAGARQAGDDTTAAVAATRLRELEEFETRLRQVETAGFDCPELAQLLAGEPLDRWSGDGIVPPASADDLVAQERAWRVDINDGVRVNVAPLQLAGLLTAEVLKPADARKALADRARWRSDERHWVRDGVLPRCGWMSDDVPESPRWTERAPEREVERARLEEKRKGVMVRLGG